MLSYIIYGCAVQRQYFVLCLKFFNLALKQTDLQQQNRVIMSENSIGSMSTVVLIAFKSNILEILLELFSPSFASYFCFYK